VKEIVKAILRGFDSTPSGLGGQRSTNWKTSLSFSIFFPSAFALEERSKAKWTDAMRGVRLAAGCLLWRWQGFRQALLAVKCHLY